MSAVQTLNTMVVRKLPDVESVGIEPYNRRKNTEDTVSMGCWGRVDESLD